MAFAAAGVPNRALAWSSSGHMVVAEIAFRQLGLAEKRRAVNILKDAFAADPDGLEQFRKDLTGGMPKGANAADRDYYVFMGKPIVRAPVSRGAAS